MSLRGRARIVETLMAFSQSARPRPLLFAAGPPSQDGGGTPYSPRIQVALGEQGGNLGHVGERQVRLVHVTAEVLERRPLELPITLLRVQLNEPPGPRRAVN